MLVLQRFIGEKIVMIVPPSATETRIDVEVCGVRTTNRVRLGTTAPREVEVHREEVYRNIKNGRGYPANTSTVE